MQKSSHHTSHYRRTQVWVWYVLVMFLGQMMSVSGHAAQMMSNSWLTNIADDRGKMHFERLATTQSSPMLEAKKIREENKPHCHGDKTFQYPSDIAQIPVSYSDINSGSADMCCCDDGCSMLSCKAFTAVISFFPIKIFRDIGDLMVAPSFSSMTSPVFSLYRPPSYPADSAG